MVSALDRFILFLREKSRILEMTDGCGNFGKSSILNLSGQSQAELQTHKNKRITHLDRCQKVSPYCEASVLDPLPVVKYPLKLVK